MEKLYIKVVDGEVIDHPVFESNLIQCFGKVDNDLYVPFTRVPPPIISVFQVYEGVTYEREGDSFIDIHHVRPMNNEEKASKMQELRENLPFPSWSVDEETGDYIPPVPYPENVENAEEVYEWDESTLTWIKY